MTKVSREEIEQLIHTTFDYYNGRINIFNNPARLIIDWGLHLNSQSGGTSSNPNTVYIYPAVIARFSADAYWFKHHIIVCIIHELFHIDQYINYICLERDPHYMHNIEAIVETETYLYISSHSKEIERVTGVPNKVSFDTYYSALVKCGLETGLLYHRRNYKLHVLSILQSLTHMDSNSIIDTMMQAFDDMNSIINVVILNKNTRFTLKNRNECMPVSQFNDIMYELFFKYNYRGAGVELVKNKDIFELHIMTKCTYKMYNLI